MVYCNYFVANFHILGCGRSVCDVSNSLPEDMLWFVREMQKMIVVGVKFSLMVVCRIFS